MEVVVTTGLLELYVVQSSRQIITTHKPISSSFYRPDALPVAQQCQSTKRKNAFFNFDVKKAYRIHNEILPKTTGGRFSETPCVLWSITSLRGVHKTCYCWTCIICLTLLMLYALVFMSAVLENSKLRQQNNKPCYHTNSAASEYYIQIEYT